MKSSRKIYRLHDSVIAAFVRAVQTGMLTQTDVTDQIRMMRLEEMRDDADTLMLTDEYVRAEERNLARLEEQAIEMRERVLARRSLEDDPAPNPLEESSITVDLPESAVVVVGGEAMTGDGGEHGAN